MKRTLHIVLVLLVAAACKGPRVIPKDTLTDIFVDMFLADQMVRDENIPPVRMDTLLVYEAVFEKYGYDTDDYLYTVRKSLRDPERFSKVFEEVAKRLEVEVEDLNEIIERQSTLALNQGKYASVDSVLTPFSKESFFAGLARVERDTSRFGAWFRLVAVQEDTLMIPVDSVKVEKDPVVDDETEEDDDAEVDDINKSVLIQESRSRVPVRVVSDKFLQEKPDVEEHAE